MVNEEQLNLIKKGISKWNEWRRKNGEAKIGLEIDLSEANLMWANLNKADLMWADLRRANLGLANLNEADLSGADLSGANLIQTSLFQTNLSKADLSKANLKRANLVTANLSQINLSRAHLNEANLVGANLRLADLRWADLSEANLSGADLSNANLSEINLSKADLMGADLSNANFRWADLSNANLSEAYLSKADFSNANLSEANLSEANLSGADLRLANLSKANMVETNLNKTNLTGCRIYGVSAWDLNLQETLQLDLIITPYGEPAITVDNLEVAQFVYLLLKNEKIRDIINTIGKKAVLILGRFTPERKIVLNAIRNELRRLNYAPIIFDFEKPTNKDFTETIMTLAGICRFIIVDITNPNSSPLELQATLPNYMIPFVPIIQEGEEPFSMFKDLANKHEWILDTLKYDSIDNLVKKLENAVIKPALKKHDELMVKKAQELRTRHINDY